MKVQRKIEGTIALYNGPWQTQPYRAWTQILALEGWGSGLGQAKTKILAGESDHPLLVLGHCCGVGKWGTSSPSCQNLCQHPADVNKPQLSTSQNQAFN
jgi:hypothetical protein